MRPAKPNPYRSHRVAKPNTMEFPVMGTITQIRQDAVQSTHEFNKLGHGRFVFLCFS